MIRAAEYFRETMYVDRFPHILESNKRHRTIEIAKIATKNKDEKRDICVVQKYGKIPKNPVIPPVITIPIKID